MSAPARPPRRAERLIARVAEDSERAHLLGDLDEGFRRRAQSVGPRAARRWYWKQAAILLIGLTWMRLRSIAAPGALSLDARRALRSLRRSPGLTLAGMSTLALGIAGPTATFGIISAMFSPLPVERAEEVVAVQLVDQESGDDLAVPWEVFRAWRAAASGFSGLGAYHGHDEAISGEGFAPSRERTAEVTPAVLGLLGVEPVLGRTFHGSDARADANPAALIREDLWEEWFAGSRDVLGAELRVGGRHYTIVGVMPESFGFPESHRVWTVLREPPARGHGLDVVGRLAPDRAADGVAAELSALRTGVEGEESRWARTGVLVDEYVLAMHGRRTRTLLWGLNLLVGLLVLIAAANVSALFLARGATRASETGLRMSIGGTRWAVVRPLALEALAMSAAGTVLGVVVAQLIVEWMTATLEARGTLPYWADPGLSVPVLVFALCLMTGATAVAGVLPALRSSRVDLTQVLKAGKSRGTSGRIGGLSALVATEVALACVLLVTSAFVVRGALSMVQRLGTFPLEEVLTAELVLEDFDYPDVEARRLFWEGLERTLSDHPGVERFSLASAMPGDGTSSAWIAVEGMAYDRQRDWRRVQRRIAGPRFFSMFGMEPMAGRTFDGADGHGSAPVAVVNQAYADLHLAEGGVVGRRILIRERGGEPVPHDIVGVVTDPGVSVDDGERVAAVFLPVAQRLPEGLRVAVRARPGAGEALEVLGSAVRSLDPELPLDRVMTLEALVRRENDGGRVLGTLFGSLGLVALLLAVVGLHGVVAFTAARRTYAIGVMRALGARESGVLLHTLAQGLRPVGVGLLLGLTMAWMITPLLGEELLGEVGGSPHDPVMFAGVSLLLVAGAVAGVLHPALRASRVDPVAALRAE